MTKPVVLFCLLLGSIAGCRTQTNEQKIVATTDKVIDALESGNEKAFENLIGVELSTIGKDKEMVASDFKRSKTFYDRYLSGKRTRVLITNEYTPLGHRKVTIPIYKGFDSVNKVSEIRLDLYYGPPNFVPLNKLSRYELVVVRDPSSDQLIPPGKK